MAMSKLKYIKDNLDNIAKWIEDGLFENQIFPKLGMSKPTWEKYKKECPELKDVLERSRETRNAILVPELENLMLKRARGYIDEEAVVEEVSRLNEDGELVVSKKVIKKSIPPDVGAIQICLKNFTRNSKDPWTDNPQGDKLRKQKQELEQKIAEEKMNGW